jgi:uncharacterized protein
MKQQVVFIHGGEAFSDYSLFLLSLKEQVIDPYAQPTKRWHRELQSALGDAYEVFRPDMPNSQNAKYAEWKIWFEKYIPVLRDGVILVGHSQGAYFLVKYLIENSFPVVVKALYLVAGPFETDDFGGEDGGDFNFDTGLVSSLKDKATTIVILHSKDDPVVPVAHAYKYTEALPSARLVLFEDKLHFWGESFPELVEDIKGLS